MPISVTSVLHVGGMGCSLALFIAEVARGAAATSLALIATDDLLDPLVEQIVQPHLIDLFQLSVDAVKQFLDHHWEVKALGHIRFVFYLRVILTERLDEVEIAPFPQLCLHPLLLELQIRDIWQRSLFLLFIGSSSRLLLFPLTIFI